MLETTAGAAVPDVPVVAEPLAAVVAAGAVVLAGAAAAFVGVAATGEPNGLAPAPVVGVVPPAEPPLLLGVLVALLPPHAARMAAAAGGEEGRRRCTGDAAQEVPSRNACRTGHKSLPPA